VVAAEQLGCARRRLNGTAGPQEDAIYFLAPTKHKTRRQLEVTNMAVIRQGNKAVLLVVDVQVGVMRNVWDAQRIIQNIGVAVEKARRHGVPVIWVQHSDDELVDGSPDWQFVPGLSPAEGEMRLDKHFNSSFEQTPLEETLARLGATHIVLVGAATNWCVRATAYGALDRGYDLTLIKDAHTTETIELENGIRIEAANIIRELNIAMIWLGYPGRTNSTASVEEVDFSVSGGVR
jgi:nicotinamidase-related amidase